MTYKERWFSSVVLLMSILPFILVAGSMQLLPQSIELPNIVNAESGVTIARQRYLFFGLLGFVPALMVIGARILRARNLVERNFMFMMVAACALSVLFLFTAVYGVVYHIVEYKIKLLKRFDFFSATAVALSLILGLMSNFFVRLRRNDILGLKNKYTMYDNRIWVKVHIVAADVYMSAFYAFAVFSAVLGMLLKFRYGWLHIILWVVLVSGLLVWGRLYSKFLYNRYAKSSK